MRKAEAALAAARGAASASSRATAAAVVAKTAVEVSEKKEASENKRRKTTKGPPGAAYAAPPAVAPGTATSAVTPVKLATPPTAPGSRPPMPDASLSATTVLHNAGKIQKSTLQKPWRVLAKTGDRVDKNFPWGDSPIDAFNKAFAWIEDQNR